MQVCARLFSRTFEVRAYSNMQSFSSCLLFRNLVKELERDRPQAILDLIRAGELIQVQETFTRQTMSTCERCGYISSQRFCKACLLLVGLQTGDLTLGVSKVCSSRLFACCVRFSIHILSEFDALRHVASRKKYARAQIAVS